MYTGAPHVFANVIRKLAEVGFAGGSLGRTGLARDCIVDLDKRKVEDLFNVLIVIYAVNILRSGEIPYC